MSKNFGFERFCKSSWFDGFIAKPHQFFSTNFLQCCQSCIQGVQMNNLWKNLTWEKSFEIDKITGCLLKSLGQLSESFRQFRQNCILTVESRFYWEIFIARTMLFGKFFQILGEKLSSFFEKLFLGECTNCLLRQQKEGVSVHFDEKTLFSKVFVTFQNLSDSKQHISSFCPLNFLAGLSKLYSGVQRTISWRKPFWNNLFFYNLFFGFWTKSTRTFHKIFLADFEKTVLPVQRTVYEKVWDKKRANKQNFFQELVLTTFGFLVHFFRPFCQNCNLPSSNFLMGSSICEWKID